jgi:hypothetical protein
MNSIGLYKFYIQYDSVDPTKFFVLMERTFRLSFFVNDFQSKSGEDNNKNGESYNGQTIGEIGNSGAGSGIHLHYEVRPGGPYGKAIDPRPYLGLLSIGKQLTGLAGQPAQVATPRPTPAQIASQGTQQRQQVSQQLAQQRNGPTVVVIEEDPPPQQQVSAGGGGGGIIPIIINPLNSFITKKLLLDLAYT